MDPLKLIRYVPANPDLFLKIAAIDIESDKVGSREFLDAIGYDQGICSRLLQVANSSYYTKGDISDLPSAVATLGLRTVKSLGMLVATEGFRIYDDGLLEVVLNRLPFLSAMTAAHLARKANLNPDKLLALALFSRIGMFILAVNYRADYMEIIADCQKSGQALRRFEMDAFGFDHRTLGIKAVEHWSFPNEMVSVYHEHSSLTEIRLAASQPRANVSALVLAELLAESHLGLGFNHIPKKQINSLGKSLGIQPATYDTLFFEKILEHPLYRKG